MTLKIGYKDYKLKFLTTITRDKTVCDGLCLNDESEIHIESTIHEMNARQALWHEIFHAFENTNGIQITEQEIGALARGMTLFILNNPEFMKRMMSSKSIKDMGDKNA